MCSLHCSIAEVLQQTRDRHQRARSGKDGTTLPISCEDATFDVMVVVLSLSLELSDNRVDLLVTDPSLPKHACARICLKGQDAVSAVLKGKLTQGDIVRFNKMRIITDYGWSTETKNNSTSMGVITLSDQHSSTLGCTHGRDGSNDNDYRLLEQGSTPCTTPENKRVHSAIFDSTTLPTVICEIRHSWVTPEIGSCFAILATICNKDTNPTISGSVIGGEWTCEFIGMDAVPCNFASPPEAVSNLFHWFISSRSQDAFMMTSSLEQKSFLNKRKRLRDITASNMLNDVVVKIVRYHEGFQLGGSRNTRIKRTRNACQPSPYVILSDGCGEGDYMALMGCQKMARTIKSAIAEQQWVIITNVVSQHSALSSTGGCYGDFILSTTCESIIFFAQECDYKDRDVDYACREEASQQFSHSLRHSMPPIIAFKQWQLKAKLVNLVTDEKSFAINSLEAFVTVENIVDYLLKVEPSPSGDIIQRTRQCLEKRTNNDSIAYCYRDAVITLSSTCSRAVSIFWANGNVMQMLCGSVAPMDLVKERDGGNSTLAQLVMTLLRGIIADREAIIWSVEREGVSGMRSGSIVHVSLPKF